MAKPKITRLGDPANPYTKKRVSAAQAKASAKAVGAKHVPLDSGRPKPRMPVGAKYETLLDKKLRKGGA